MTPFKLSSFCKISCITLTASQFPINFYLCFPSGSPCSYASYVRTRGLLCLVHSESCGKPRSFDETSHFAKAPYQFFLIPHTWLGSLLSEAERSFTNCPSEVIKQAV